MELFKHGWQTLPESARLGCRLAANSTPPDAFSFPSLPPSHVILNEREESLFLTALFLTALFLSALFLSSDFPVFDFLISTLAFAHGRTPPTGHSVYIPRGRPRPPVIPCTSPAADPTHRSFRAEQADAFSSPFAPAKGSACVVEESLFAFSCYPVPSSRSREWLNR